MPHAPRRRRATYMCDGLLARRLGGLATERRKAGVEAVDEMKPAENDLATVLVENRNAGVPDATPPRQIFTGEVLSVKADALGLDGLKLLLIQTPSKEILLL